MPGLPSSSVEAVNNNLGNIPASPSKTQLKIGQANGGPLLTLYYPPNKTDLAQTFVSGQMPEAAGTAMDEKGRGIVGVVRCAASTAGSCSSVTKTDPVGSLGTTLVTPGSFVLSGADTDGDMLFTETDPAVVNQLVIVVGGALAVSEVGTTCTFTVTNATTASAAATYFNANATMFIARALGTGASVCPQATSATSAVNGRLNVTPLKQGQTFAVTVPNSTGASLSSAYAAPAISASLATDAKKKPTTTAAVLAASGAGSLGALATANPGVFTVTAGGTGALPPGALTATPLVFGSTGAMTVSTATPNDSYDVAILVTVAGALGTSQARWSLDGGKIYSDPFVIPGSGVYTIPGTGITVTFTGVLAVGDLFTFACAGPAPTLGDITAALDYLLDPAITDQFSLLHIVGEIPSSSLAAIFAALASYADQFENAKHYLRICIECARPTSVQSNAAWATAFKTVMATLAHPRMMVCMMTADIPASIGGAQRGRTMRRSSAWPMMARAGAFPVGRDIGDQTYGQNLTGVSKVYEIDQGETLALARFSVLYSLVGVPGFVGEARLADAPTGDYTWLQYGRLIDECERIGYAKQTTLLSSASRRRKKASGIYPAGSIDPGAALNIEDFLTKALQQELVVTGQCTDVAAVVDRTITTALLKIKYNAVPLIYWKTIQAQAGLVLSTSQTF